MPDGAWVKAGRRAKGTIAFAATTFSEPFAEVTVVFSTVTSVNEADAVVTRMRQISVTGFQVPMQEQESNRQKPLAESVAYIAWEPSFGVVNGVRYEVGRMDAGASRKVRTLVYRGAFAQPPLFLADMQTTNGGDPANLRWRNRNEVAVEAWVSEDQSKDSEMSHTTESVGYFALERDFSAPPPPSVCATGCSLWTGATTPSVLAVPDSAVELGVKFHSDVADLITGIRYYKSSLNTGTHLGSLWSAAGELLARATFNSETDTGWQSVQFSAPVPIDADTVSVASYHTNASQYSLNRDYFRSTYGNEPLHTLVDGESGGNGVYLYGAGGFPTNTWSASNYWLDVVFKAQQEKEPPAHVDDQHHRLFRRTSGGVWGRILASDYYPHLRQTGS